MNNSQKIILDLCGGSGAWSAPYKQHSYDVRLVTLPDNDVRLYIPPENVYGILAAPPCTHLAVSGARWWKAKGESALLDGLAVVDACLRIIWQCNPKFWGLENPVGRLNRYLGKPTLIFNPCDYGDPWTKKTCVWGNFNTPFHAPINGKKFIPNDILSSKVSDNQIQKLIKVKYLPENYKELYGDIRDRQAIRSITPPGFARAFFEANR